MKNLTHKLITGLELNVTAALASMLEIKLQVYCIMISAT